MTVKPGTTAPTRVVLASASPRRHAILSRLGFDFSVDPANIDETPPAGLAPVRIAEALAARKLRAVARRTDSGIVVAADTIVAVGDELLGKPEDPSDARRMLRALSGTTHDVITGVAIGTYPRGHERIGSARTRVTMRPLLDREIDGYVASGEPFGKAGGYAIQETADRFVTRLEGEFDNVVGFPAALFLNMYAGLLATLEATLGGHR